MLTETLSNHPAALVEETSTALDEQQRHVAWHEHHVIELRKQRRAARSWWQILQRLKDRREVETLRANGPQVDPGLRSELARRQAGMAAEDRAAYELSVLSNDWRLFRGYANRRGEVDLLLVGPQGIWAVEVKGRAVVVHVDGHRWTFEKFDRYGNQVGQGVLQDKRGRSWGQQVHDVGRQLEKFLSSRGLRVLVNPVVAVVNDNAAMGSFRDSTVMLSIGTGYLLGAIRDTPVVLDSGARDRVSALIRRDHNFHANRRL
ncbi:MULTISPECIES: nuclease-related domain-containing protein [unclassified Streptomyces]|uniref:nuclease-related domain-containing protein n=1 Tax=unclassified Streptomyces TaxID=2593676 RepID=UPI0033A3E66A